MASLCFCAGMVLAEERVLFFLFSGGAVLTKVIKFYNSKERRILVFAKQARKSFDAENAQIQEKLSYLIHGLTLGVDLGMPHSRVMSGYPGLRELRVHDSAGQVRGFYFLYTSEYLFVLHIFRKKAQKTRVGEIQTALKRLQFLKEDYNGERK